jgi:MFS family permease
MLDLSLFRRLRFTTSTIGAIMNYICVYSILFLTPFFLIQGRGLNPAQTGLLLTSQPVIMAVIAPISGTLSDKLGSRSLTILGLTVLAAGLFVQSLASSKSPLWITALGLAIAGLGTGIFISPNNSALLGSAPAKRQGIASGILATSRNVGMVLGIGLAGAILTTTITAGSQDGLISGIKLGFICAAGIALLGAIVSSLSFRKS